jgi:hypothetical protein
MNESVSESMSESMNDPNQTTGKSGQSEPTGKMTLAEFEERLPDFFGGGSDWNDPRFQAFLTENPDSAALVSDLKTIAEAAKDLFDSPEIETEPSPDLWDKIANGLKAEPTN